MTDGRARGEDWLKLMTSLARDADLEHLMVNGSIVRIHQHGAAKKQHRLSRPQTSPEAVFASGFTQQWMPWITRCAVNAGQASEYEQATAPFEGFTSKALLTDKGYDSEAFVGAIQSMGAQAGYGRRLNGVLRT